MAIALYRKTLTLVPDTGRAYTGLAEAYAMKGNLDSAASWYRKLAYPPQGQEGAGNDPYVMFSYALLLCRMRNYTEAAQMHERGIEGGNPKNPSPTLPAHLSPLSAGIDTFEALCHVGIATTELFRGEEMAQEGVTHCREADRLKPNLAIVQYYLGRTLGNTMDRMDAWVAYHQAVALDTKKEGIGDAAKSQLAMPQYSSLPK